MASLSSESETLKGRREIGQEQGANLVSTPPTDKVPLLYYKDVFLSSIWILVTFILVGVGIAYLTSILMRPTYKVTTTIMVAKSNLEQSSNYDTIMIGEKMARTYAEMITSEGVLEQVSLELGSNISPAQLKKSIIAMPILNTQIIEISVEESDPTLAVKIADKLTTVLSFHIEQTQLEVASSQDSMLDAQLKETEKKIELLQEKIKKQSIDIYDQRLETTNNAIADLRDQIAQINEEMAPLQIKPYPSASEKIQLSNYQSRKDELSALLSQYQSEFISLSITGAAYDARDFSSSQDFALLDQYQRTYLGLMQTYSDLKVSRLQNTVSVVKLDRPTVPEKPIRPILMVNLMLGFSAGLFLSVIYIFITKLSRR